jgi:hypothetical protein
LHSVIPILIIAFALFFGIYFLFVDVTPALAVHFLLLALYFFLSFYEGKGKPFRKPMYYLLVFLLTADGLYFLFFYGSKYLLSGVIALFFAYSAWSASKRVS